VATTTVVTGPASAVAGADVTLNVQVSPVPAGGTVQFKDGAADLGQAVTLDAAGKGSITQQFAAGDRQITAVFSGAGEFLTSTSAAHTVAVAPPAPVDVVTTTVVTGPATAVAGADVTLAAQVSPTPSGGTVQFKDGTTNLGGPVAVDAAGKASITQKFVAGNRQITAVFSGAGEFLTSTSAAHALSVTPPAPVGEVTTTSVTGPATATTGGPVDLRAKVTVGSNGAPIASGGTITFKDGGTVIGKTTNAIGGQAQLSHTFKTGGAHSVTAEFSGITGTFLASVSQPLAVEVAVTPVEDVVTTTVLKVPAAATTGVAVNLIATVSPSPVGGTVQFKDGENNIGTPLALVNGKATRSYAFPTAGDHQISAVYSGAAGYLTSSTEVTTVPVVDAPVEEDGAGGSLGTLFGSS
ncbi:Ig-like domain-containing protein, partial [Rhodococcus kronopolitis]